MTNTVLIYLLIIIFALVTANIIQLQKEMIIIENSTLNCTLDTTKLELKIVEAEQDIKKHIYDFRSVCDTSYTVSLPEDRDVLYRTLSYVAEARAYELDKYDCTEKAGLLVTLLKELGYNRARTKFVNIDCEDWNYGDQYSYDDCKFNSGHLIVQIGGIYLEATSGMVIMPEDYHRYNIK